jgi:hypothetical protein
MLRMLRTWLIAIACASLSGGSELASCALAGAVGVAEAVGAVCVDGADALRADIGKASNKVSSAAAQTRISVKQRIVIRSSLYSEFASAKSRYRLGVQFPAIECLSCGVKVIATPVGKSVGRSSP